MNTTDLCDALDRKARVIEADWRDYGGRRAFEGPAATVVAPEDNTLVRQALEEPGRGRVLVVDGGGSRRCALVGGQLGALAVQNGWAGLVVFGCVRDSVELAACDVGIKALGTNPRKSEKKGRGEREASLFIGGAPISPGEWICADADGVVVTAEQPGD